MGGGEENIRTIEQLNENLSLSVPTNYDADCSWKQHCFYAFLKAGMLTHVPVVAQLLPEQNFLGRYKFNITCMLIYRLCFTYISLARFGEYDSHFQVLSEV